MIQDSVVSLDTALAGFADHWAPRTVVRFNACDVMVVKARGEFVPHIHDGTELHWPRGRAQYGALRDRLMDSVGSRSSCAHPLARGCHAL